jgi:glyoxylase-like metal-dependent hydrolase (beta-lactamase superfamily II)
MNEYSFSVHEVKGFIASVFIAEYKDKILILDGGSRVDAVRIKRYVETVLKRPFSDVLLIVSTHPHPDHAGGANLLRKWFKTPIAAHKDFDKWYRGAGGFIQHKFDTFLAHYSAKKNKGRFERMWYPRKLRAEYKLQDKQYLPFFEDWQTVYIPGHTAYDIALYNKPTGVLVIGDIVILLKNKFHLPIPVSFKEKMKKSLLVLDKLNATQILMAHGGIINNPPEDFFTNMLNKVDSYDKQISKTITFFCSFAPDVKKGGEDK